MFNTDNLIHTYYEPTTDTYELEFKDVFIKDIPAEQHPFARIDEYYWDDQRHIDEAIIQGELSLKDINASIISQYLEVYPYTNSTELDERFHMFKSDVYGLAEAYRKNEAYVSDIQDYIDWMEEVLHEEDAENLPTWLDSIEEAKDFKERGYRVVIDRFGQLEYI